VKKKRAKPRGHPKKKSYDTVADSKLLSSLSSSLRDDNAVTVLFIELTTVLEFGRPIVECTYMLETDACIIGSVADLVEATTTKVRHLSEGNHPEITAACEEMSEGQAAARDIFLQYSKTVWEPACNYYHSLFADNGPLGAALSLFQNLRLFKPSCAASANLQVLESNADSFAAAPLRLSPAEVRLLKTELPTYQAQSRGAAADASSLDFFAARKDSLPTLNKTLERACLLFPTSAFAERIFSILKSVLSDQRSNLLEETIEVEVMHRVNT
jgi:hypothetical protein